MCGAAGVQTSSLFSGEHPVVEKCRRRSEIQRTVLLLLLLLLLEFFVLVAVLPVPLLLWVLFACQTSAVLH